MNRLQIREELALAANGGVARQMYIHHVAAVARVPARGMNYWEDTVDYTSAWVDTAIGWSDMRRIQRIGSREASPLTVAPLRAIDIDDNFREHR